MDSFNNDESNEQLLEEDKKEDDNETTTETTTTSSAEVEQTEPTLSEDSEHKISIKLKFINDDQKLVTGSLKEMLGDFKR